MKRLELDGFSVCFGILGGLAAFHPSVYIGLPALSGFLILFIFYWGVKQVEKDSQNTIKHVKKGKYKKEIDAIIDKSSKVRKYDEA